jgi:hypothetical protein
LPVFRGELVSARDDFLEVCEASRAARHRLVESGVSKNAMQLFHAVDYFLMTYSRLDDRIARAQLVEQSGLKYKWDYNRARDELLAAEVLAYEPGEGGRWKPGVWGYHPSLKPVGEIGRQKGSEKPVGETGRGTPDPTDVRLPISDTHALKPELQDVAGERDLRERTKPAPTRELVPVSAEMLAFLRTNGLVKAADQLAAQHVNGNGASEVLGNGKPEPDDELVECSSGSRPSYFVPRAQLTCRWCGHVARNPGGRGTHERQCARRP